jgi:SAM-dependent methyltransferase
MQVLYAREIAALSSIVSGVYGNYGLFLKPHPRAPIELPANLLGNMIELAPDAHGFLQGALCCAPTRLPFASESFKLIVVQHVLEQIDEAQASLAELARVLAPEGVALILGFNPLGTWRPWLALHAGRVHLRSAQTWRVALAREQIDTLQIRFPGTLWPRSNAAGSSRSMASSAFARFGSSWLLLARKRRSTLTPLRLRASARELALNPRLAPGAQRARA